MLTSKKKHKRSFASSSESSPRTFHFATPPPLAFLFSFILRAPNRQFKELERQSSRVWCADEQGGMFVADTTHTAAASAQQRVIRMVMQKATIEPRGRPYYYTMYSTGTSLDIHSRPLSHNCRQSRLLSSVTPGKPLCGDPPAGSCYFPRFAVPRPGP